MNHTQLAANLRNSVACGVSLPFCLWIGTNIALTLLRSLYFDSLVNIM